MSLAAATRSEFTKQFTTAMWWILAVVLVAYVGFTAAGLAFVLSATATGAITPNNGAQVPASGLATLLYSLAASVGYVFPLLIGTLMVTAEFRHQTLTPTFLATPRRGLVMAAKVVVGILIGALYSVLAIASSVGPAAAFLSGYGLDTEFTSSATWALLGRIVIAFVLWALIGVGVGALVRNQVAAIVIVLAFTQFIEPLARLAATFVKGLDKVTQFLPGAASDALVGSSIFSVAGQSGGTQLHWWAGGLVLLAYAAVFVILGHVTSWRRDVS
ncbi:ABC transporter permease [Microbacterium sp.]|uniref:ABC transporter permease n=1 Tax=Microbacterium sp. TaxID=51671 RepID=UPI001ACF68F2|nr:ABC transporter permease [Microbacterium sp.]MBN9180401.1 ABC transporter permease [Microbacterium sp.]MBN9181855.1 ABC transporter permease [Microbacterium sp.]MBN9184349.1 ABC transporter permease [Microbacterium sp.]MBN9189667.1 ABC transporter permease [Microbacterium sp.]MBN9193624.1 ABC transporter permease [Microbacterium sp.]